MPRVENLGPSVNAWSERTGEGSSTHDVCTPCHQVLEGDPNAYNDDLKPYNTGEPQGEEGWGGDVAHPLYEEQHPPYTCKVCGAPLTAADNGDG